MKTIGLIGGMSWESSAEYYRLLNEGIKSKLGGFSSCQCLMYSVNFAEIEKLQFQNDWKSMDKLMAEAAQNLHRGGADMILLCTNTMHLCSEAIKAAAPIPFLHIAEAAGEKIAAQSMKKVALLGTKFTMEKDFYKKLLLEQYNIETIIPEEEDRQIIHDIIYGELVLGQTKAESKKAYLAIIEKLIAKGTEGIILGCTEIPLLIKPEDVDVPIFDTTKIHAEKAIEWALTDI